MKGQEGREEAIRRQENGKPVTDIYLGIDRSKLWFLKWFRPYRKGGKD